MEAHPLVVISDSWMWKYYLGDQISSKLLISSIWDLVLYKKGYILVYP
jgi:hypothetical protein